MISDSFQFKYYEFQCYDDTVVCLCMTEPRLKNTSICQIKIKH